MTLAIIVLLFLAILINVFVYYGTSQDQGITKDSRNVIHIFLAANTVMVLTTMVLVAF